MIASPHKTIFTVLVCCSTVLNTSGVAQACWLTDWLWGHNTAAAPVAPPVITTGYAPVAYPVQQVNYQSPVCGPICPPAATTTAGFLPQVDYQSQFQQVPTTVYRPVPVYQPNSAGVPVVGYQGCTTSQYQVQRVPTASFAPAATSPSCGCGSQGYSGQAMPSVSGGTYQSSQPGTWLPRAEDAIPAASGSYGSTYSGGASSVTPETYSQGQIQAAPSQGSYGGQGSIYQSQPSTVSPAPMTQQYQQQPLQQYQQQQPADQRPALRPDLQYDQQQQIQVQPEGPALNGSGTATIQGSTSMSYPQAMPSNPATAAGTMQRPNTMTVSPSSASSSPPNPASTSPWQVAPVTPIPDPEFSTSGPRNEAPQLLDPRDKTAGLDQSPTVVPVSHQMSAERPTYKPPTASIQRQSEDSGWYSAAR